MTKIEKQLHALIDVALSNFDRSPEYFTTLIQECRVKIEEIQELERLHDDEYTGEMDDFADLIETA